MYKNSLKPTCTGEMCQRKRVNFGGTYFDSTSEELAKAKGLCEVASFSVSWVQAARSASA